MKQADDPKDIAIEKARADLTNLVLKPALEKRGVPEEILPLLAEIAKVTMVLDRANACLNMKLDFKDPECPRGFLWIHDAALLEFEPPVYGKFKQTCSITSAYLKLANLYPPIKEYVREMIKPRAPQWMVDRGLVSGIEVF